MVLQPPRPGTSFAVSAVKLAEKPLPTQDAKDLFAKLAGKDLEASGGFEGRELLADTSAPNAFVQAAHLSFAEHRPLVLSPDMIWLLINQMAWQVEIQERPKSAAAFQALFDQRRQFQDDILPMMTSLEEFKFEPKNRS